MNQGTYPYDEIYVWWWTRTGNKDSLSRSSYMGFGTIYFTPVAADGSFDLHINAETKLNQANIGIRPALWVDVDALADDGHQPLM